MDDNTFHIPDQPNEPQSPPDPNRPDGADSAADIARAKLQAIYNQQNDTASDQPAPQDQSQPSVVQPQTPTPQQPVAQPEPATYQQQPGQPAAPSNREPVSQQPHEPAHPQQQYPAEQPASANQPEPIASPEPTTYQPQTFQPQQHSPVPSAAEYQPPASQPEAVGYQPQQPEQTAPTSAPVPEPAQPQIIQPTPAAEPQTNTNDAMDFHIPGQMQSPAASPQTDYVPAQQYAQEVSLEDQIDGLRHTAPDHQLPIQSQSSQKTSWIPANLQPFLRTLALAAVIAIIYNHQFLVGQVQSYINPAQSVVSPAIIAPTQNQNIGDENKILIPKINVDIPVVYDVTTFEESAVQAGLERGVVHYGNTPLPGENGNNVIVGHSSNNFWNNGEYKFAFVLLNKLQEGDTFTLHYEGTAYTYEVFRKKVVPPTAVDVIFEDFGEPVTTLITCDPPGTSWNRLIVNARQISPDPDQATTPDDSDQPDEVITVPSDSTSLLDNLFN